LDPLPLWRVDGRRFRLAQGNHAADAFVFAKQLEAFLGRRVDAEPIVSDETLLDEKCQVVLELSVRKEGVVHDSRLRGTVDGRLENHRDYVGPAPVLHRYLFNFARYKYDRRILVRKLIHYEADLPPGFETRDIINQPGAIWVGSDLHVGNCDTRPGARVNAHHGRQVVPVDEEVLEMRARKGGDTPRGTHLPL